MIQDASLTGKIQGTRDAKGRFVKGVSGCPGGKLHARTTALGEIAKAIEEYQKEHDGVSYWKAATILAMRLAEEDGNTTLLCKIMDKFVPSKIEATEEKEMLEKLPIVKLYADGRN